MPCFFAKTNSTTSLMSILLLNIIFWNYAITDGFSLQQMFGGGRKDSERTGEKGGNDVNDVNVRDSMVSVAIGRAAEGEADGVIENPMGLLVEKPLPDKNMIDVTDGYGSIGSSIRSLNDRNKRKRLQEKMAISERSGSKLSVDAAAAADAVARKRHNAGHDLSTPADDSVSRASSGQRAGLNGGALSGDEQDRASVHEVIEAGGASESEHTAREVLEKEKDRYAGTRKEIKDLSHQLNRDYTGNVLNGHLRDDDASQHGHVDIQTHEQTHTLLARGIEDAMTSLMNVYKDLRVPDVGNDVDSDIVT